MKKLLITIILVTILSLSSVYADTIIAKDKVRLSNGLVTIYSYDAFVYTNGRWYTRETAPSLLNSSYICQVDSDKVHIVKCLDFNWSTRTLELDLNNSLIEEAVSLNPNDVKMQKEEYTIAKKVDKSKIDIKMESISNVGDKKIDKKSTEDLSKGKIIKIIQVNSTKDIIHIGENSTLIQMNSSNTENIGDTQINAFAPNNNYEAVSSVGLSKSDDIMYLVMYNITSIPAGSIINDASLGIYFGSISNADGNISAYHITGAYLPTTVTYNTKPTYNSTAMSTKAIPETGDNTRYTWNVTYAISKCFSSSQNNCSIGLNVSNFSNINANLVTKEGAADQRPWLTITYGTNNPPTLVLDLNFTNFTSGHSFNVTAIFSDLDGATNITSATITSSSGTCTYISNTTATTNITLNYNCTGTALASTNIQINVTDSALQTANTSIKANQYPNQLPSVANPLITPDPATVADDLTCTNGSTSDIDGDTVTLSYDWYNGTAWQGINNQLLKKENLTTGQTWYCKITPNDGYQDGTPVNSQDVTIDASFSAPVIGTTNATTTSTNINSSIDYPTNNNSWINLSVNFTDPNTGEKHTAYFCDSSGINANGCIGTIYCLSEINSTDSPILSCRLNATGLTSSVYTYYVKVVDNSSLSSGTITNTFHINHPPTFPTSTTAQYFKTSTATITFTSTDSDGDSIYYNLSIGNSTYWNITNTTLSLPYTWASLIDGTYFMTAMSYDTHNYSYNYYTTTYNFTIDTINPALNVTSPIEGTTYNSELITLTINATDANIYICNYSIYYRGDTLTYKTSGTANCNGGSIVSAPYFSAGYLLEVYAFDYAGNVNSTQINFTTVASGSGSPGGSGGSNTDTKKEVEQQFQNATICGNGVCQSGENPLTCPADCPLNFDEVLCVFGSNKTCPAWAFSLAVYVVLGTILIVLYYRSKR